jgi:hypothetical protein
VTAYLKPGDKIVMVVGPGDNLSHTRENVAEMKRWFASMGVIVAVDIVAPRAPGLIVPVVFRDEQ